MTTTLSHIFGNKATTEHLSQRTHIHPATMDVLEERSPAVEESVSVNYHLKLKSTSTHPNWLGDFDPLGEAARAATHRTHSTKLVGVSISKLLTFFECLSLSSLKPS